MPVITLAKTDLETTYNLKISFQKIYGIGPYFSSLICKRFGLNPNLKLENLNSEELLLIDVFISNYFIIGLDLKRKYYFEIKKHIDLKNFKGLKYKYHNNA